MAKAADTTFSKLRRFNGVMAVLHLVQGLLMLFLSGYGKKWPITTTLVVHSLRPKAVYPTLS